MQIVKVHSQLELYPFCTKFLRCPDKHLWCCSLTMMEFITSTGIGSANCDRTKAFRLQGLTMLVEERNFLIFHFDWNKSYRASPFPRHGFIGSQKLHHLGEQFLVSISVITLFLIRDVVSGKDFFTVICLLWTRILIFRNFQSDRKFEGWNLYLFLSSKLFFREYPPAIRIAYKNAILGATYMYIATCIGPFNDERFIIYINYFSIVFHPLFCLYKILYNKNICPKMSVASQIIEYSLSPISLNSDKKLIVMSLFTLVHIQS